MIGESVGSSRFDLDHFRMRGDPPLDEILTRMAEELQGYKTMTLLFQRVHEMERIDLGEIAALQRDGLVNQELVDFLWSHDCLPERDWIDVQRLELGGNYFRARGVLGFLVLACASLPACYCWHDEAAVLGYTGKLTKRGKAPRRLPETAQFVIDAATPDALVPGGVGIRAALKVRLLHGVIRYLIVRPDSVAMAIRTGVIEPDTDALHHDHADDWEAPMGAPISQEFLAGTLLTFSYVVLLGLRKLGVRARDEEAHAYLHRWNALGCVLGVDEQILRRLETMEDARDLFDAVMRRNRKRSETAFSLEAALLDYQRNNVINTITGGRFNPLAHMPAIATRWLAGRATSRAVYLQLNGYELFWYAPVLFGLKLVGHLSNWRITQRLTKGIIRAVSLKIWGWAHEDQIGEQAQIDAGNRAPKGRIVIPSSLVRHWELSSSSSRK